MPKPILNIADVEFREFGHGVNYPGASDAPERFSAKLGDIGRRLGAQKLGYNVTVVPPGKCAWPFHNHRINEEMFLILEGEVRIGGETFAVMKGDVIANPPGGPETAHQIINTSDAALTYLAVSTRISPEIVDYPDSNKFGVMAELADADGKPQIWRFVNRSEANLNYWDGE